MSRPTLNAALRTETGKGAAHRLRTAGKVPAVVYGKGKTSAVLSVDPKALVGILDSPGGRYQTIDLQVEGEDAPRLTLIKELVLHPVRRTLRHVDFWQVEPDQTITVKVPLRRAGVSPLEKLGGKIRFTHKVIKVRCTPTTMPPKIEFDMSGITEAAKIKPPRVSDITMPDGVQAIYNNDYSFMQVKLPKAAGEGEEGEEGAAADGGEGGGEE